MLSVTREQIDIDTGEIYRYMGYGSSAPDESVSRKVNECVDKIRAFSELRCYWRRFPLDMNEKIGTGGTTGRIGMSADAKTIRIGSKEFTSSDLHRNLKGCVEVYVFGATIGVGVDRLIARASVDDMIAAAIYQAAGAAYIEAYCDVINEEIDGIATGEGRSTRPRFSPGYGDLALEDQRKLFDLLDLTKHTGISLTEGMLMMPSKSVTAIIGVTCDAAGDEKQAASDEDQMDDASKHRCETCDMTDCKFRKNSCE